MICYYNLKYFLFLYILNAIYSCNGKAEFSVSHDPSEIIQICSFGALETFLIIINVENSFQDSLMNET